MKKLFVCLLTLIVCFAVLVACGGEDTTAPATTSTPESTTEPSQGTTNTGLEDAKAYLVALYKDSGEATPVDYELIGALRVDGVSYTLEWSVGDVTGVTVTRKDATTVLIDVVDGPDADIPYTLTATITDADGNSIKAEFAKKVPKFKENTFAEYVEAENDALLIVKGVVSGIIAKSKGNTANCIYVQDTDGGYYVYGLENDPVTAGIEIGMTVRVTGKKDNYNGTYELKSASVEILNDGAKTDVVAKDLTDAFKAATDLKAKELIGIQGMYVTLKGVTIGELGDNGYHYFTLGNHTTYVRISSSTCPLTKEEQTAFTSGWSSHLGWTADIAGVISVYDGKFYLTPCVPSDATFKSLPELDDAGKVAFEKGNLTLVDKIKEAGEITVPTAGVSYTGVTISWASDNACITVNGGKLTVTLPTADTTVKVTATLKSGDATDTVEFEVKVVAPAQVIYTPELVKKPEAATAYKFAMSIGDKIYYFTGKMTDDNKYLVTSEDSADAIDVYIETVEGGARFYFMNGETKTYIDVALRENDATKANIILTATPAAVWTYDEAHNIYTAKLGENSFFLGTYGTYTTVSVSSTYYITGDKEANLDVSQYPVRFYTLKAEEAGAVEPTVVTKPVADKAYKFAMSIGDKIYYFTGEMSSYYMATSEDSADAIDVYIETVEGGVRFYFMNGETKTYIDVALRENDATKANISLTATPAAVWTYDEAHNIYTAKLGENSFFLGTYGTYTTISVSSTYYITGDKEANLDVSQYPARFYELVPVAGDDTPDEPVVLPDPTPNDAPTVKIPYSVIVNQNNLGKVLYLTATLNGRALATTDDPAQADEFYLEVSGDGYAFYVIEGGKKVYLTLTVNTKNQGVLSFTETATAFTYDPFLKAWTAEVDGAEFFLGTTEMYGDVYACLASFLTAENTGVKQFPAVITPCDGLDAVEAATLYKFGLFQTKLSKMLFVTGEVNGRYLVTTDKIEEAANVFVEESGDGYKFFLLDGKDKKYIDVYFNADKKLSVQYAAEGDEFIYNRETKAWATTVDGTAYYLGTYNTFDTISASKTSYINAENTGVEQFPAGFYALQNDGPATITIPEFKAIAAVKTTTEKYIVTGTVTNVVNTKYGNLNIKDETGDTLYVYGTYSADGSVRYDSMAVKPKAGDTVTLLSIATTYNGSAQMSNAWMVDIVPAPAELTIPQFNEIASAQPDKGATTPDKYTVVGTITKIVNTKYGNMYVQDADGNELYVYGLYSKDGSVRYDAMTTQPKVGDTVTLFGVACNYNGPQMKNAWLADLVPAPEEKTIPEFTEIALAQPDKGATTTDKYVVVGTIKSIANTTYGNMTITDAEGNTLYIYGLYSKDGSVRYDAMTTKPQVGDTITVLGVACNYNGAQMKSGWLVKLEAAGDVEEPETPVTPETPDLPKADATISFATADNRTTYTESQQVWSANGITMTNNQAASTSKVGDFTNPVRIYKSTSLLIECTGMKTIVFDVNTKDKTIAGLVDSLTNCGGTVTTSGNYVIVEFETAVNSLSIESVAAQFRLNAISITK